MDFFALLPLVVLVLAFTLAFLTLLFIFLVILILVDVIILIDEGRVQSHSQEIFERTRDYLQIDRLHQRKLIHQSCLILFGQVFEVVKEGGLLYLLCHLFLVFLFLDYFDGDVLSILPLNSRSLTFDRLSVNKLISLNNRLIFEVGILIKEELDFKLVPSLIVLAFYVNQLLQDGNIIFLNFVGEFGVLQHFQPVFVELLVLEIVMFGGVLGLAEVSLRQFLRQNGRRSVDDLADPLQNRLRLNNVIDFYVFEFEFKLVIELVFGRQMRVDGNIDKLVRDILLFHNFLFELLLYIDAVLFLPVYYLLTQILTIFFHQQINFNPNMILFLLGAASAHSRDSHSQFAFDFSAFFLAFTVTLVAVLLIHRLVKLCRNNQNSICQNCRNQGHYITIQEPVVGAAQRPPSHYNLRNQPIQRQPQPPPQMYPRFINQSQPINQHFNQINYPPIPKARVPVAQPMTAEQELSVLYLNQQQNKQIRRPIVPQSGLTGIMSRALRKSRMALNQSMQQIEMQRFSREEMLRRDLEADKPTYKKIQGHSYPNLY